MKRFYFVVSFLIFISCSSDSTDVDETILTDVDESVQEDENVEEVVLSDQNSMESFTVTIGSEQYGAEIDQVNRVINLTLPFGTDLTQITPNIILPDSATVSPESGSVQNFQSSITYVVTAENGDIKEYTVTIVAPNTESKILNLVVEDGSSGNISGFVDEASKSILIEVPNTLSLSELKINLVISENATSEPSSGSLVDLNAPLTYMISAESGNVSEYRVATYTENQLFNPSGDNNGAGWNFSGNCGVESDPEFGNIFYIIANDGDISPDVNQTMSFSRDYSEKYILFIGNLTTEKVVPESITRRPYLWAYQIGNFSPEDWIFMQGMRHQEDANIWEVVFGTHKLLNNVTGTHFKIAQGRRKGDPYDGTKSKYRDLEVRIFESEEDANIFVDMLYRQQSIAR